MFEKFFEHYESEEHEVIVLIEECISTPKKAADNSCIFHFRSLAAVFCDSGDLVTEQMCLDLPLSEEDCKNDTQCQRFVPGQICKLKIRKMKKEFQNTLPFLPWCISQIINEHEECPTLSNLLEESLEDVVIEDEMLGELEYDKYAEEFTGGIPWCDDIINFAMQVNVLDKESWAQAISVAKTMVSECESWDKNIRKYAANLFTEHANDFLLDVFHHYYGDSYDANGNHETGNKPKKLTKRQFASALDFYYLNIDAQGNFYVSFRCLKYLGRETIAVEGNVHKGIETAYIE
ncbi:DUF2262 domain-containing protein [Anaerobiospirillum succiniciproducens]|uniref:DUF2262 domain-containing protein n=1 Tax=Anaerobiospirillum succiniciproducens TaxID=13335 RepID=UPI003F8AE37D